MNSEVGCLPNSYKTNASTNDDCMIKSVPQTHTQDSYIAWSGTRCSTKVGLTFDIKLSAMFLESRNNLTTT